MRSSNAHEVSRHPQLACLRSNLAHEIVDCSKPRLEVFVFNMGIRGFVKDTRKRANIRFVHCLRKTGRRLTQDRILVHDESSHRTAAPRLNLIKSIPLLVVQPIRPIRINGLVHFTKVVTGKELTQNCSLARKGFLQNLQSFSTNIVVVPR